MNTTSKITSLGLMAALAGYFSLWPVPVDPQAWQPEDNAGLTKAFQENNILESAQLIPLEGRHGPEDLAIDNQGQLYTATDDGWILKFSRNEQGVLKPLPWVNTGGRVLGLEFDQDNNLIAADVARGLLKILPDGKMVELLTQIDGQPIAFIDDVDITADGRIVFSDASTKFAARDFGGATAASKLDINEHGGHGRVYIFNPANQELTLIAEGLNFANGITISHDQKWALVNESGSYQVWKLGISQDNFGEKKVLIKNLPGFPDNIAKAESGGYWLGLVSPRNAMLDGTAGWPSIRKLAQRLPPILQPQPSRYGHVVQIDEMGNVLQSLQGPSGQFALTTGAVELEGKLYISSLHDGAIAAIPLP